MVHSVYVIYSMYFGLYVVLLDSTLMFGLVVIVFNFVSFGMVSLLSMLPVEHCYFSFSNPCASCVVG